MKVLLLVNQFPPVATSAARLFGDLAEDLARAGHDVSVVTTSTPAPSAVVDPRGVRVLRTRALPLARQIPLLRALEQVWTAWAYLLAGLRLGRQHVVLAYSPPLPLTITGLLLARMSGGRGILNIQDLYPKTAVDLGLLKGRVGIRVAEAMERIAYRQADAVTVHSAGNRDWVVARGAAPERARVVFNWVDAREAADVPRAPSLLAAAGVREGQFVVFYGGAMGFAQALDDVLGAAEALREEPGIVFLLVGDGVMRKPMEGRAAEAGLRNVLFRPTVPPAAYRALLAASDVALVTLRRELASPVVPGKLQSIMAAGVPALVSTHPASDARTMVREARCGLCVDAGRPRELADAILALRKDPAELAVMGARGRAYALQHFDRARCTRQYVDLVDELATANYPREGYDARPQS